MDNKDLNEIEIFEVNDEDIVTIEVSGYFAKRMHQSVLILGMLFGVDKIAKFTECFAKQDVSDLSEELLSEYALFETLVIFNSTIQGKFEESGKLKKTKKELPKLEDMVKKSGKDNS